MSSQAFMRQRINFVLAAAFLTAPLFAPVALAAGDNSPTTRVCVERDTHGNCTKWKSSSATPDDLRQWANTETAGESEAYLEAVQLAKAGKYRDALTKLEALDQPDNANVLNYLGYTNRKLGNIDRGIAYYREAILIDPDHAGAHEYLGEAFLQKGNVEGAKVQLRKLEAICGGRECEQYHDLAEEIRIYETENRG